MGTIQQHRPSPPASQTTIHGYASRRSRVVNHEQDILEHGLQCAVCDREATSEQIDQWLDRGLHLDSEAEAWVCPDGWHICDDCNGEGRPRGLSGPQVCGRCKGQGEYDEHDADPWPEHPSERGL